VTSLLPRLTTVCALRCGGLLLAVIGSFGTSALVRANSADEFLAGLRSRGWHDVALDYLQSAGDDPLATPQFLEKLDYERAVTQMALARETAGQQQRQALLDSAASGLQKFAQENSESPLQLQALATAGNLLTEQAVAANNQAEKLPSAARGKRDELQSTSRELLERAAEALESLENVCAARLKSLPKPAELQKDPTAAASQQQLLAKQAEAKFLLAQLDFEKARTYEPKSKQHAAALKAAAEAFEKLYEEYDQKLVGFYARLYQGRALQATGKLDEALDCFWDLVDQPPIPNQDFRRLVARAIRHRAEIHQQQGDLDKVVQEATEWLEESRGAELSEPDWLAVSYQLANAYDAQAAAAEGNDAQRLTTAARKLYRDVAKAPGEFQLEARAKMASGAAPSKLESVKTFDEAFRAGQEALEQMNSAKLTAKLARENNPSAVESLQDQVSQQQTVARQYFEQAVVLADEQTDAEQLVTARYYLCWLYWEAERLEDVAVVGEFIARRFPEHKYAALAAKLTLAAYERLYNTAKKTGKPGDFEGRQLASMAELLVERWPESPEAATGMNLLINMALRDDRLADAEKMLERLSPARRASAQLRLGSALWTRYLQASRTDAAGPDAGPNIGAPALKEKAGQLLSSGYEAIAEKPSVTAAEATGLLYYAQFLLADDQAAQAIAVLENSTVGPLHLVESEAAAASNPGFVQETFKVALRAFVSIDPPARDKAQAMMAALEAALGDGGEQKLIGLYVNLGLQLQQQIRTLSAEGKTEKARAVATAFEDLLARVTERAGAADSWQVQNWIAQTNLQLGQGLSGPDAERYFQQATDAYQTLIAKATKQPKFAPSPMAILSVRKQLADCLLAQKKFSDAFNNYAAILRLKPNMPELQQAAATALLRWGTDKKIAEKLEASIRGTMPGANKKNLVWGWLRIAKIAAQAKRKYAAQVSSDPGASDSTMAARVKKYENLFFEARLNAARARFEAAKLTTGAERTKQLGTAKQSVTSMQRLYPDLGGPQWQSAYQRLLAEMEQMK